MPTCVTTLVFAVLRNPPSARACGCRGWANLFGLGKEERGEVLLEMTYKVSLV